MVRPPLNTGASLVEEYMWKAVIDLGLRVSALERAAGEKVSVRTPEEVERALQAEEARLKADQEQMDKVVDVRAEDWEQSWVDR